MPMTSIYFLFFFCFFASSYNCNVYVSALNSDGLTLLALAKRWTLPPRIRFSWNASDADPCSWVGVQCDNTTQSVTLLNLTVYGISGQLGPEIGSLKQLEYLDISNNSFSGPIPPELGNCSLLYHLDLSLNLFHHNIPLSLSNLRNAQLLNLGRNSLNGTIPESLFSIPSLEKLYLDVNKLSGRIPTNVGNASKLVELWLSKNLLYGTVPSSLGDCSALQELNLDVNQLSGPLPQSLSKLQHLIILDISKNMLEGDLPFESGNCKSTELLDVSYNLFHGSILPAALGNCTCLIEFSAISCGLTGLIPPSLGQLLNLKSLQLASNRLSGLIPPELGNCRSLVELHLAENQLTGRIPSELGLLTNLEELILFTNHLSGEIPVDIVKIQSLRNLTLSQNNLTGGIPIELTELAQLEHLLLAENQLTGDVPRGLGVNASLLVVDLSYNNFTGHIPPNLCFRKQLFRLILARNGFQGRIPYELGSCSSLGRLRLDQNNLTGELPQFVENINPYHLDLSKNGFTGRIPLSLVNLTNITTLDLSSNKLSGIMPPELGSLVHLGALNLAHNRLEGNLPTQLENCKQLWYLDVSDNFFNGQIPANLETLQQLTTLHLSDNHFAGELPFFLFEYDKLYDLQLGGNLFSGNIPPSVGSAKAVKNLRVLNLSSNRLTGEVGYQLGKVIWLEQLDLSNNTLSGSLEVLGSLKALQFINVSHNLFSGSIPKNLWKFLNSSSPTSFLGNSVLCLRCSQEGDSICSSKSNNIRHCPDESNSSKGLSKVKISMIALGSLIFVSLMLGLVYMFLRLNVGMGVGVGIDSVPDNSPSLLDEIMTVTENLNDKYIIGRGAHGTVYKAAVSPDKVYAVKKLTFLGISSGKRSMIREIETIGMVRHRNLIKLVEFWFRKDYGLLLYNYMENGSLQDVLHGGNPQQVNLTWECRYKIALGIAHGLSYLHFDCDPAIVHRDIKPMNILLDSDMEPHISDFGISKLLEHSTNSSSAVLGTIGYIAPENAYTIRRSKESDVYSYGVVLLELITRKKALLDPCFNEEQDIVGWVQSVWNEAGKIIDVIDPSLLEELKKNSRTMDEVSSLLVVALRCTEKEVSRRPSIRDVVKQLVDFRHL